MGIYLILYKTKRLILRPLKIDDIDLFVNYYKNNMEFLKPWTPKRTRDYYSKENLLKVINGNESSNIDKSCIFLAMFFHDENKIIGFTSISNIVYGPFLSCYLGYNLDKDEVGKGYMNEALTKVIDICFKEYGLHRIEANIIPYNTKSINVVKKLGFVNEGLSLQYLKIDGEWRDHNHYVLLNSCIGELKEL